MPQRNTVVESAGGKEIWTGLEDWFDAPEFREMLDREFPDDATEWKDPVSRRTFLTVSAASAALAGAGCSPRPASPEKIYPYVKQPEQMTLGLPLFFATGFSLAGVTTGILVKSREGRPIKVEGNPSHPGSMGRSDAITQSALLGLYDPDRSRGSFWKGEPKTWETAVQTLKASLETVKGKGGSIRILSETVGSPTMGGLLNDMLAAFPKAKWIQYEPVNRDNARAGAKIAFGEVVNVVYDFTKAARVVSLDADFLNSGPGSVRYARDFNLARNAHLRGDKTPSAEQMNRLYVVESMLTSTGSVADHRIPLRSSQVESFARALAIAVGATVEAGGELPKWVAESVAVIADDLKAHKGKSVVVPGEHQSPVVHALAQAINQAIGAMGETAVVTAVPEVKASEQLKEFRELVEEMRSGTVDALIILGGNPVYATPAELDFKAALAKVKLKVHMGLYQDETAVLCDWHLQEAHSLEVWGDGRAFDGTATVYQPLIAPLHGGRSTLELLAGLLGKDETHPRELVKAYWQKNLPAVGGTAEEFSTAWQRLLRDGVIAGTASPKVNKEAKRAIPAYKAPAGGLELNFRADPTIGDGRFTNNGWLQELPKPITKLTWDNAIIVSPKTAADLKLTNTTESTGGGEHGRAAADVAELTVRGKKVKGAVWIQPGHVDDSVTVYLGHGRSRAGKVGNGTGFNAYLVQPVESPWIETGAQIAGTTETAILACTQSHFRMEGRRPVRSANVEEYELNRHFAKIPKVASPEWQAIDELIPGHEHQKEKHAKAHDHSKDDGHKHDEPKKGDHGNEGEKKEEKHDHHDPRLFPLTLYPDTNKEGRRWGMAIDLTACNGCSACLTACMAENNTPVVGKKEVTRGREMHWIRIDRYYEGNPNDSANLQTHFQPVPCQQCEKAPCEVVCPVAATAHSTDGLNDMVYNRCVGTRYCSNNCPYKVRRFNFLTFADWKTDTLKLMRNPEVSVRERGVMEKCTYCVQRIRSAEIEAERQFRPIEDGEIVTACQQACPSGAIVFGDLADTRSNQGKGSLVRQWKKEPTNYALLGELNTMPRTTYLAAIRNPNPKMPEAPKA